jgi:hypothetical protein
MFTTAKFALATALILTATLTASAAPKARAMHGHPSAVPSVIPGYGEDGGRAAIPNPNRQ